MPGGAGFLYGFVVDGTETSWKNIEISDANPGVDTTSRLNPDGSTNTGFADREYDVSTATITLTEMARASDDDRGDITSMGAGFAAGDRDETSVWTATFDGVEFASGTGLYCMECSFSGSIPGEGRDVTRFQAIGDYSRNGN